jgi:hypothetical protein
MSDQGLAFKHLDDYEKTKGWLDQSVTWIVPTRGMLHYRAVESWESIDWPMNQVRSGRLTIPGMEVGEAYNYGFRLATDYDFCVSKYRPDYSQIITGTRFVFTTEDDNILPPNAITGLMEAIYTCPDCGGEITDYDEWRCAKGHHGFDVVSGLYFTKSLPPRPMAYGNPANGLDDFTPQSVKAAVANKSVIEVNGVGMGCAIWRKGMVTKVSTPWFKTVVADGEGGGGSATQDLFFCRKAKEEAGARFGVHGGVKVGHVETKTGRVF